MVDYRRPSILSCDVDDDASVESLALNISSETGNVVVPSKLLYRLALALLKARAQLFRLELCQTVDDIVAEEIDDLASIALAASVIRGFKSKKR